MQSTEFWNQQYSNESVDYVEFDPTDPEGAALYAALDHFGDVSDRTLVDLGCGNGKTSLFFAARGARVVALDTSQVAIDQLSQYCEDNNIDNVETRVLSAHDVVQLEPSDFMFGSMILHHIEPFDEFVTAMRASIKPEGKAFFYENSANSQLLVWCRNNLVGRFGVPKYGDDDEFPLTPDEVRMLSKQFAVRQVFPELFFFRLISQYLLRMKLWNTFTAIDNFFYRFPSMAKYSYRQWLFLAPLTEK